MAVAKSSPLLKVIGIGVGLFVLIMLFRAFSGGDSGVTSRGGIRGVPQVSEDADTVGETLQTLSAEVRSLTSQLELMSEENAKLKEQNETTRTQLINQLEQSVNQKTRQQREELEAKLAREKEERESLLDNLSQQFDQKLSENLSALPVGQAPSAVPVPGQAVPVAAPEGIEWIGPVNEDPTLGLPQNIGIPLEQDSGFSSDFEVEEEGSAAPNAEAEDVDAVRPIYTLPENATLLDATAMTALIGRVPFGGSVKDPFRFKVLVSADNLATNGILIPDVVGMVASGVAVGDYTLGCVSGKIDSMTFTFEDGTIHTVSEDGLGSISNPVGLPCVPGERISNATAFLIGRLFAAGASSLSGAIAKAETEEDPGEDGGEVATNIVGDAATFAAFETAQGAADELGEFLEERQAEAFDAILVRSGAKVAIHIEKEVEINYDPKGRKVSHEGDISSVQGALLD